MDIFAAYAQLTQDIVNITGMSRPMLHLHAGMAIYLGAQVVLGTRRGSLVAVVFVLQIELLNEMMNRFYHGSWRWADTSQDIALTLFWPTLAAHGTSAKPPLAPELQVNPVVAIIRCDRIPICGPWEACTSPRRCGQSKCTPPSLAEHSAPWRCLIPMFG